MSERQREETWAELQERRSAIEARRAIVSLEAALADVEAQLEPAMAEEGQRRAAYDQAGWEMFQALAARPAGASMLADREDPERVELDQAEDRLAEMTRIVGELDARRARIRQALTRIRAAVAV